MSTRITVQEYIDNLPWGEFITVDNPILQTLLSLDFRFMRVNEDKNKWYALSVTEYVKVMSSRNLYK